MPHPVAVDYETFPFSQGNMTPPAVCLSVDAGFGAPELLDRERGLLYLVELLRDPDRLAVLHNAPYDLGVAAADAVRLFGQDILPEIFAALDRCGVTDTGTIQKIVDLGEGHLGFRQDWSFQDYSLESLARDQLGVQLDKGEDGWRQRFPELAPIPVEKWPERARAYAMGDSIATRAIFAGQRLRYGGARSMAEIGSAPGVPSEYEQVRADFALHLTSCWGLRTDRAAVEALERHQDKVILDVAQKLAGTGLLQGIKRKEKAIRATVFEEWSGRGALQEMPLTEGGQPSISAENLRACQDTKLHVLADLVEAQWIKANPLKALWQGVETPINTRYNVLLKTGRTSSSGPNVQNFKRSGGIRECFVPRPGFLFCSVDYETLELRTLAQDLYELFGVTEMVKALLEDRDLHVDLAALMLGVSYERAYAWHKKRADGPEEWKRLKAKRQFCKPVNFGIPGGMGRDGLIIYAAGSGVQMSPAQAEEAISYYMRRWPEMPQRYFPFIKHHLGPGGYGRFTHPVSGLVDGRASFTEMSNARFQGRAAHGAKRAVYETAFRCYADRKSALYGSRPVAFLHDEQLVEVPEECAHEAGHELAQVMIEQMQIVCPNIPIKAAPALMRRWYKDAEAVYVNERLVPYEPKAA